MSSTFLDAFPSLNNYPWLSSTWSQGPTSDMYNVTELTRLHQSLKDYEAFLICAPIIDPSSQTLKELLQDEHNLTAHAANVKHAKKPICDKRKFKNHAHPGLASTLESGYATHVNAFKVLHKTIENCFCISNFHVAMIHLSYLQEENFHGTLPDWDFLFSLKTFTQVDDTITLDKDPNIIRAQSFRLPLHAAVLISPIFLLSNFSIYKYPWERDSLLEYSYRLGNMKPEILLRVERLIWTEFFSVYNNVKTLHDAMTSLVKNMPWGDLANVTPEVREWFNLSKLASGGPSQPLPISNQSDTCCLGAHRLDDSHSLHCANLLPEMPATTGSDTNGKNGKNGENGKNSKNSKNEENNKNDDNSMDTEDQSKEGGTQSHNDQGRKSSKPKKKRKNSKPTPKVRVQKSSVPPTNSKPSPLDPLTVLKREVATIEEGAHRQWTKSEDITLRVVPAAKNYSCTINVFQVDGQQRDIKLDFHEEFVCRRVREWHKAVEQNYVVNNSVAQPLWLMDPTRSTFAIVDHSDLYDISQIHYLLQERKQNIMVKNVPGKRRKFGFAALQEVQHVNHTVDIHDHSIKCGPKLLGKRLRSGTLAQVLQCATMENGKILNALDLPMPTALLEESSFMTDLVSWRLAMGELNCPRGEEYPTSKFRWALVITKGGTHWVHVDNDSFATFICPRTGAKWWIIATPKEGFEHAAEFAHLEKGYDASLPCPDLWNYEAILLTEGMMLIMRPNTRHTVFTVKNTIVAGGYFYSTPCLPDSMKAMTHCFNADGAVTNNNTPVSQLALQRMLSFFHTGLVKQEVHHETDEFQHLPVIESTAGCQEFVVAWLNTSSLTIQEREQYMYVRGLSYVLVEWIGHHYNIQVDGERPNVTASSTLWSFNDILFAIGQFLADVVCYQRHAQSSRIDGAPGCNPDLLEVYIRKIFSKNGVTNDVYQGYHIRSKEIAIVGDSNHHITYGPIFTGTWHAKKRSNVGNYQAKDLQTIMSMGNSDGERDICQSSMEGQEWFMLMCARRSQV
ncbi:hypothetical protein BJ165DRAFT_1405754 [Panaeolus papilionaceus]|nr:hypothetical protein BJ165DRAFT_1405754 [Panaeolus papilionaceus]